MIATRNGHNFTVSDNDLSGDWGFWSRFSDGTWEPEILDRIETMLDGGTYLDIGSWIGPQLLVASPLADRCVGFEPDPTAFAVLSENVAGLDNVNIYHAAIADRTGTTTITTEGNSESRIGTGDYEVACYTLADAVRTFDLEDVSLVKIDIEGAEQEMFPQAAGQLEEFGCPVFLSLHPGVHRSLLDAFTPWRAEWIGDLEVLLWP